MADLPFIPARTALIDVGRQNCFVEGSPLASPDRLALLQRKAMGGGPAAVLQQASCASPGTVFAPLVTIDDALGKIAAAAAVGAR